ncbi:hypothetical protein FNF31_03104 [Cafeteria roenbergensis]|uniref:Kinesin-like protein n=1 Tax=Cafeteria roenbergensis TaxID=33653 RepID=A0A5A8DG61_CAFRO|nr:hypothetical protein FNF31_03104 [Cafeteria roenbergensis]
MAAAADGAAVAATPRAADRPPRPDGGIRVYARVRPMIDREVASGQPRVVFADGEGAVAIEDATYRARCEVSRALAPKASQADAWQCVADVVPMLLAGYNATVLAYGHTSSGKTFTLFGDMAQGIDALFQPGSSGAAQSAALAMHPSAGIIPRALATVFASLRAEQDARRGEAASPGAGEAGAGPAREADATETRVFVSALQVYNEDAFDLLAASPAPLEVRESSEEGVFATGLQEFEVTSAEEALGVVAAAAQARVVRETEYNMRSSRSHTLIQLVVERHADAAAAAEEDGAVALTRSRLSLVDLAGSERWDTRAASGWASARVSELTSINSSLFVLTKVIAALARRDQASKAAGAAGEAGADADASHVPYRESVLTRLLQDGLGGNAVTCIFCTLTPAKEAVAESLNTLLFADAAKRVMTRARVNDSALPDAVVVRRLRAELLALRRENLALRERAAGGGGGGAASQDEAPLR